VCKEHANVVEKYAVCLENFRETVYKSDNVESMVAFFHDKNVISECRKKIEALGGIIVVQMWDNLEVMSDEAGKGKALVSLAESLVFSADDTISMGDGDNDRSMIKAAVLGLAVSNGNDHPVPIAFIREYE
jgi:hydroxymethylpyrimidine pyrophosphatase-like HAD family hydrolase